MFCKLRNIFMKRIDSLEKLVNFVGIKKIDY